MSAMGLAEGELLINDECVAIGNATGTTGDPSNGSKPSSDGPQTSVLPKPVPSGLEAPVNGSVQISYANAVKTFRTAMVTAVHVEQSVIQSRNRNFVVSGLPSTTDLSDKVMIEHFVAEELNLPLSVSGCRRLGDGVAYP